MLLNKLTSLSIVVAGVVASPVATFQKLYPRNSTDPILTQAYTGTNSSNSSQPCATVASLAASFTSASPSAIPTVPAELAYQCLKSIPFNYSAAAQLVDSIDPYLNWQSTFDYVKSPPAEYAEKVQAPYDFYAVWNTIKANVTANTYPSEYDFGLAVYRAMQDVHDGHMGFLADVLGGFFTFGRNMPLVSVSMDGKSLPQPYLYSDILAYDASGSTFIPSPIVSINGQDAIAFLEELASHNALQDEDAAWNRLFYVPAQVAQGPQAGGTGLFDGGGSGAFLYPGNTTTLTFSNGSTYTVQNYAQVLVPFDGITSGADLYSNFLIQPPEAYQSALDAGPDGETLGTPPAQPLTTSLAAPAYPTPFVSSGDNSNTGYFINEPGYEDVAVLAVRSFEPTGPYPDVVVGWQSVNTYFIETAAAMGKKKLIIDVSGNGGGLILAGFDLFKLLFPSILPYGGSRHLAQEALNLQGEQVSYLSEQVSRSLDNDNATNYILSSYYDYQTDTDTNYQPFTSWAEKYRPVPLGPGSSEYTAISRWNMSDVLNPDTDGGIEMSGYGGRSNITVQHFAPENIIVVTDGYCASTCTTFLEMMTHQAGVKTVALGGRPQNGIIQAVGGTKGQEIYDYGYSIFSFIDVIASESNATLQNYWATTVLNDYNALPVYRSLAASVNVRNAYRQDDPTQTPLQFVYQPADCRILYTPAMLIDEAAVWKTVADSTWGTANACIATNPNNDQGTSSGSTGWTSTNTIAPVNNPQCRPLGSSSSFSSSSSSTPNNPTPQQSWGRWSAANHAAIRESFSLRSKVSPGKSIHLFT